MKKEEKDGFTIWTTEKPLNTNYQWYFDEEFGEFRTKTEK